MVGSTRAELTSSTPEGSGSLAGYQRGAYSGANLDRSGSFREGLETRAVASGSGTSRNAALPAAEAPLVGQYLNLEPFMLFEQKYTRYNELRRVLGVTLEEQHSFGSLQLKPLPSTEEVKRFRTSLEEQSNRARDRRKLLNESILKLDKFRNILSKKQQRNELSSSEKPGNSHLSKIGVQSHQNPMNQASQRLDERAKNGVNKRVRSSMAESEGRSAVPTRPGMIMDKEKSTLFDSNKNMLRTCNGTSLPSEDKVRGLPAGGDGWEKKLKRKRSVGTMVTRIPDCERELKQPFTLRPSNESRPRSCDSLGFRPGSSCGITGTNKVDPSSQLSVSSSRVSPRNDMDNASLPSDRRERFSGLDKERVIAKGSNKLNAREDALIGGHSSLPKGKASRAPRSASGGVANVNSSFPHPTGGIDGWEQPSCLNKVQPLNGVTNRKRPLPTGSSSPPVTQWVGQRPQKISRTRRANVVSPVSNFDESQISSEGCAVPDVGSRLTTIESSGLLLPRGMPNNTHQLKLKFENVSSPANISESDESGAIEIKSRDKDSDNGELEDGSFNAFHKAPTLVLPAKKNKVNLTEEIGDGVRRQGRSGRGSVQSKGSLSVAKYKSENINTTKPPKNGKPSSDKSESRIGRPPLKKASDRKAYIRSGQVTSNDSPEMAGESDDDREELVAAANFACNASYLACSSSLTSFWVKMELFFAFISPEDISYVKDQITFVEELDASFSKMQDAGHNAMGELACQSVLSTQTSCPIEQVNQNHGAELQKYDETTPFRAESEKLETERWFEKSISLSQTLLSSFITEDGTEQIDFIMEQGDTFLQFSSDSSPYCINSHVDNDQEADPPKSELEVDLDFKHNKNWYLTNIPCNGYTTSSNLESPNIHNLTPSDELLEGNDILVHTNSRNLSEIRQASINQLSLTGLVTGFPGASPLECQYEQMSLDERILMELHSIGLYPETVPDLAEGEDEEIDKVIWELKMRLYQQVGKNKDQLSKLEKAIQVVKEIEERKLEQLAINKLVEMAYKKLKGGRGSHGSSHKSGASKISKQLALAFAKRTLARCRIFEETGRSCFSEPALRDLILSLPLYRTNAKSADGISSKTSANIHLDSRGSQLASGALASGVISTSERNGPSYKLGRGQVNSMHDLSQVSEPTFAKSDQISNRGKKREVLLDDVVTSAGARATATLSHTSPGGSKWKRADKDRDQNKDTLIRNSSGKVGRPSSGSGRGERKMKTKPKQKIAQLSTSGNGVGRITETTNFVLPSMQESIESVRSGSSRMKQGVQMPCSGNLTQDVSKEIEDNIFSNLPLHGIDSIDELDVADGLGGQGQDIASWLNVDEDTLQDHDLVGLEIPMDDLSELKLNF